jgi:hypothetical protein
MAYASASDVTARWARTPTDEETTLIDVRLEDAERLIRRRIPDLDAQVSAGDVAEDDVIQVEAEAVLRLVRNPEGYMSESDGNYTYMLRNDIATGRLEILSEEWEILGIRRARFAILVPNVVMPQ